VLSQVAVPGDRTLYVVHGLASTRRALVYLHGVCGDVTAVRSWTVPLSRHGTLIALLGDKRCDVPNRYRWDDSTVALDARIDRAVGVVARARNGLLDATERAVLGYSQGATRAAVLVRQFPEKYRWVLLAGVPIEPRLDHVGSALAVAVVGGERDATTHMRRGVARLVAAGKRAEFFELPDAGHGEYGPDGARIMGEALAFLFGD
jgi:pimeloyl-ACP methyl ester carboxylesterase